MSLPGSTPPVPDVGPAPTGALPLEHLVDEVDRTHPPGPHPTVLRVTERPLQVGRLLLDDGGHPLDVLLGFTAPPTWAAIGLRCQGHAYDLVDEGSPDEPPPAGDLPRPTSGSRRSRSW